MRSPGAGRVSREEPSSLCVAIHFNVAIRIALGRSRGVTDMSNSCQFPYTCASGFGKSLQFRDFLRRTSVPLATSNGKVTQSHS